MKRQPYRPSREKAIARLRDQLGPRPDPSLVAKLAVLLRAPGQKGA
jgi:hypothetical protein